MIERRCSSARPHKAHWWSRTTKRTVTEATAGDTLQCPGSGAPVQRAKEDVRGAQIAADARSGRNWASEVGYGPACACGAFAAGSTITSWGKVIHKAACHRHGVVRPSRLAKEVAPVAATDQPQEHPCPTCAGKGEVVQPISVWNHQTKEYVIIQRADICQVCGGRGKVAY